MGRAREGKPPQALPVAEEARRFRGRGTIFGFWQKLEIVLPQRWAKGMPLSLKLNQTRDEVAATRKGTTKVVPFLVAQRVGFEPTCGCPQTDFESAPL